MITHLGVIIAQSNLISKQKYEFHEHFLQTKESFKILCYFKIAFEITKLYICIPISKKINNM